MLLALSPTLWSASCTSDRSMLEPAGPEAENIADLSWIIFTTAGVVTLLVFALLGVGLVRHRRARPDGPAVERRTERWVIAGGVVLPVVVLAPIAALSIGILDDNEGPTPDGAVRVEVIGHQFWWEYRYPDLGVTTANELHLPVDRPVELTLRADDVIHSFWVPRLTGKEDLVPGHDNTLAFRIDEPGTYRGQCAEFCGIQHAKMRLLVVAEREGSFRDWVEAQRAPAEPGPDVDEGRALFTTEGCASCHAIRGTAADGVLGPELTHVASRRMLAANVIENTPENLRRWIADTWDVKDHVIMPPVPLSDAEVDAIARYLESLE